MRFDKVSSGLGSRRSQFVWGVSNPAMTHNHIVLGLEGEQRKLRLLVTVILLVNKR